MKRFILRVFSSILLSITGCQQADKVENQIEKKENENVNETQNNNETLKKDVRENVWNQLTNKDKKHIKGTWEDASVRKITLRKEMGSIKDETFIEKEVYIIDYPSNDNTSLGGVVVYADIKSQQLIGYGYRE